MSDESNREQITDSCRVIMTHASFVGTAAAEVKSMPDTYSPPCMDELEETEGVLRRALAKIEQARRILEAV